MADAERKMMRGESSTVTTVRRLAALPSTAKHTDTINATFRILDFIVFVVLLYLTTVQLIAKVRRFRNASQPGTGTPYLALNDRTFSRSHS